MTVHVVTRHHGALDWLRSHGIRWDRHHERFDARDIKETDQVIGILPMRVAARICALGARYLHICINMPNDRRGSELTLEEMIQFGASLEEFRILMLPKPRMARYGAEVSLPADA